MFRGLSPLEEGGFEPSVPRVDTLWFRAPRRSPGGLMVVEIPVKTDRLNRARLSRGYGSTGLAARNLFLPHIFNKDRDIPMLKIAMEIIPSKKVPGALYSRARIFPECPKAIAGLFGVGLQAIRSPWVHPLIRDRY
jgi:hypothetical protein